MDDKSKKTALKITSIITVCCLLAALAVGVVSRFTPLSEMLYFIIAYIALITMLTDTCIRKKGAARFFMVLVYGVCIAAVTILIFF